MEINRSLTGEHSREGDSIVFTRVFVRLGDGLCAASFVGLLPLVSFWALCHKFTFWLLAVVCFSASGLF